MSFETGYILRYNIVFIMFKKILASIFVIAAAFIFISTKVSGQTQKVSWWPVQSIDTVKYSRDIAREKADSPEFDSVIDKQVKQIASVGATHIAIGTPYDEEFIPFMKRWLASARKYGLKVWFRGNFSGWEEWFGYKAISRGQHLQMVKDFISKHSDLFQDGDIFSSCPECENGGPGDPRKNDLAGFRQFLIDEYKTAKDAFRITGKTVITNYFPMNGDVAKLVMDKETTKALGGVIVVDHYVATPSELATDVRDFARNSGGKVVLGEFGAPIPDIQGKMTEDEQAAWIDSALSALTKEPDLIGLNYWTSVGGSTQIWDENNNPTKAVSVIGKFFLPKTLSGTVIDETGGKITGATVTTKEQSVSTNSVGQYTIPFLANFEPVEIAADGYNTKVYLIQEKTNVITTLKRTKENVFFTLRKILYRLFSRPRG